jgi:DHA1 family bicyclomycin/chloramphenicol resistance-like MFS transporter
MSDSPAEHPAARLPHAEFVAMVALLMAPNAMAVDVLLPALQQMGRSLAVADENTRQLPLTAYILAFGASQLLYGPIADRYGRRPVLMLGLAVYVLACMGAAAATGFGWLLAMRAVQGIGAGATRVVAMAVVRDTFSGRRMASVMSLAMMVFMAVPIIAPMFGQALVSVAGWRAILAFMAAFGLAMMAWSAIRLPETLAEAHRRPLRVGPVLQAIRTVLTTPTALAYAAGTALTFGYMFGFLNSAQQVYQGIYGLGWLFPVVFSSAAVLMAAASFTNSRLVGRFGMRRLSHGALVGFIGIGATLSLIAVLSAGHMPFWWFYLLNLVAFGLFGFIGANFNTLAMEPLGHVAGTAASVIGFLQTFAGGVIGALIGRAYDGTVLPLSLGMLVLSAAAFCVLALAVRGNLFGRREAEAMSG